MSIVGKLIGFGFRQVIGDDAGRAVESAADAILEHRSAAEHVTKVIVQHFTDHSKTLPNALALANDRSWQALSVALAGDGLLDKITGFFASGDDKGVRDQIPALLAGQYRVAIQRPRRRASTS